MSNVERIRAPYLISGNGMLLPVPWPAAPHAAPPAVHQSKIPIQNQKRVPIEQAASLPRGNLSVARSPSTRTTLGSGCKSRTRLFE